MKKLVGLIILFTLLFAGATDSLAKYTTWPDPTSAPSNPAYLQ
ncbi:hypothetical protein CathTA2_0022 [Caldalkalibacillus thermarum TA2.A1]|uniref:Uncharacterized protein n=1 Tax=Caldalkalibacillus thermarum (strain TA2.A1) TaxID=986075 RepID=F5LB33_CALTT|nr:hypothetical protein [Caldalkalibacillus thermarum]EGL81450.1 hypothetical protein CathTA2_0022 [Caldalkalibacillus thermarum TA2.A1]